MFGSSNLAVVNLLNVWHWICWSIVYKKASFLQMTSDHDIWVGSLALAQNKVNSLLDCDASHVRGGWLFQCIIYALWAYKATDTRCMMKSELLLRAYYSQRLK